MRDALAERIRAFIDSSLLGEPSEPFERLALDIHAYQVPRDDVVARLTDDSPRSWQQVPAVPVDLFKYVDVGTVDPATAPVQFMTSGTTGGGRGVHNLADTKLYDHGSTAWMQRCVPDAPTEVLALLHDPATDPASSLSHMVALFPALDHPTGRATWHLHDGVVDQVAIAERLASATEPLFIAATAFALADWLAPDMPHIPDGSVLMVTGGFKGRVHRLDGDDLYKEAERLLTNVRIVTEYGMTELSSQLWGTPSTPYRPPPWLRAYAVDPHSGAPLPAGTRGQLRFVDLCNLDSTLAIETLDGGVVHEDGSVTLHGRLPGAPARGCSLTVEEAWEASR